MRIGSCDVCGRVYESWPVFVVVRYLRGLGCSVVCPCHCVARFVRVGVGGGVGVWMATFRGCRGLVAGERGWSGVVCLIVRLRYTASAIRSLLCACFHFSGSKVVDL